MENKDINQKENKLISLLQEKERLKNRLKEVEDLAKPLQEELKPFREEHLPRVNPKIFTKDMELIKCKN